MSVMSPQCSKLHNNASSNLHYHEYFSTWHNEGMSIRARIDEAIALIPGMTYRKLSLKAGLSDSMMHKFMTSSTQSMSIDKLIAVADALNVDPRWLIFGEVMPPDSVISIWDKIAEADKPRALAILEALATDAK